MTGLSITGWPKATTCPCGAPAAILGSTRLSASYACRGTPTNPQSACGRVFTTSRPEALLPCPSCEEPLDQLVDPDDGCENLAAHRGECWGCGEVVTYDSLDRHRRCHLIP